MNIGLVTTWFERGAAYVSKQYRDVLVEDHRVFVYARGGEATGIGNPDWDHDYVTWGKLPDSYAPTDINLTDFHEWLISNEIEMVIFNEQKFWAPVLLCRELGIRNGAYIDYYTEKTVPLFWTHDFLICNTLRHKSVFKDHPQCLYIPWGTDLSIYKNQSISAVSTQGITFFHSAGMNPFRKGTDLLLKAFYKHSENARLVIHSQVKLATFFPELTEMLLELVERGVLVLREETVSAPGLYHLGDVYVYPSRLDGIGLTIMEAAACGLPVIVPDNGPMNEFVENGINGRVTKVEKLWSRWDGYYWPQCEVSVESLAEMLGYYIDSFAQISEFKKAAVRYAENNFNWRLNAKELSIKLSEVVLLSNKAIEMAVAEAEKQDSYRFNRFKLSHRERMVRQLRTRTPKLHCLIERLLDKAIRDGSSEK